MQSDDGKMMKFMISFEALWKFVSEEIVMHECLRALDAQATIFVMPVGASISNYYICSAQGLGSHESLRFIVPVSVWELKLLHL